MPLGLFVAGRDAPQIPLRYRPAHQLSDAEFLARLVALGVIPKGIQVVLELIERLLPAMRTDVELDETYNDCEEPPRACPIIAMAGKQDPELSLTDLDARREQISHPFQRQTCAGGYFFVLAEPIAVLLLMKEPPREQPLPPKLVNPASRRGRVGQHSGVLRLRSCPAGIPP